MKDRGKKFIRCPRCGKLGHLQYKSVRSYYYPEISSSVILTLKHYEENPDGYLIATAIRSLRRHVKVGKFYLSEARNKGIKSKKDVHATKSDIYRYLYVAHYDPDKYHRGKQDYDDGLTTKKPNGRTWCYYNPKGGDKRKTLLKKRKPKRKSIPAELQQSTELVDIWQKFSDRGAAIDTY